MIYLLIKKIREKIKIRNFFFSILTAVTTGLVISIFFVEGAKMIKGNSVAKKSLAANVSSIPSLDHSLTSPLGEEGEEDPTFISRFSRGVIYNAPKEEEIIKSDSFPRIVTGKNISALEYGVVSLERDINLLEKDAIRSVPIASITKLVTAVVAKKLLKEEKQIEITKNIISTEGNTGKLRLGEKMRVGELLYPLLMVSSNDAAEALAISYGRKEFIKEMNNWVNSIGAYNTYFTDPSGLSFHDISTVRDLSIITKWILKNEPEIFKITTTKEKTIRLHRWINPTHFLNLTSYVGGKNGFTLAAGRTSLAIFELGKEKKKYLVITLGGQDRDNDAMILLTEALK